MKLTRQDFLDIGLGGTVLGTGGGGSVESARGIVEGLEVDASVELIPLSELDADARIVVVAAMGLPEAMLKTPITTEPTAAFDALASELTTAPGYVMPIETSGFNMLVAAAVAASRGLGLVDADPAGRAIPKLDLTLLHASQVGLAPLALADAQGRHVVLKGDDFTALEAATIGALGVFGWSAGLACYPVDAATARAAIVEGTITAGLHVGQAIRAAVAGGTDVAAAVLGVTGGRELVRGTVRGFESVTEGSYTFGILRIAASAADTPNVSIKSMNENMLAWDTDTSELLVAAPDRVCFVRPDGAAVTNADLAVGDELIVLAIDAQSQWASPAAARLFTATLEAMGLRSGRLELGR